MLVKRTTNYPNNLEYKEKKVVTYIWASDGWTYIPELKIRRRYLETNEKDIFEIIEQNWVGVIFLGEYLEKVSLQVYSEYPRIWSEEGSSVCELYVEIITNQK